MSLSPFTDANIAQDNDHAVYAATVTDNDVCLLIFSF